MSKNAELKLISQYDASAVSYKKLQSDRKRKWGLGGISTGIKELDLGIGGFLPQKVTVFAARSGTGKTSLINTFISGGSPIRNGRRSAFLVFSWELDASLLVTREICRIGGVTQGLLLNGAKLLGAEKMKEIDDIYKICSKYDVRYQTVSTDVNVITKLVDEFVEECKINEEKEGLKIQPIVLVDFIQMGKGLSATLKTYQLQEMMVGFKQNANKNHAHYALLAQLQRAADDRDVPVRNNVGDSKFLEDISDSLILMYRPEYNDIDEVYNPQTKLNESSKDKMLFRIVKDRNFGTRDFLIGCKMKYFRFFSLGENWDYDFTELYESKAFWLKVFGLDKTDDKQQDLELYKNK